MRIKLGLGGGRWRVLESSNFIHNHERDPKIVKDPTWRPYIRNTTAREAVEKRDEAVRAFLPLARSPSRLSADALPCAQAGIRTNTNSRKRDDNPGPDPPPPKKQARGPSSASLPERPAFLPQPPPKVAATVTTAALPSAAAASATTPTPTPVEQAVPPPPPPPPPASTTVSPAPPAPARRSAATPSFHLPPPDPAAFLADLTAFLSALGPSLAPLARPLHSAGISTLRDLRAFVQFEPASRMALYEDLHSSGGDAAVLDVELVARFEELLVAASASGWR